MSEPATLYVSCNPKEGPVARFGARGVMIGASRSATTPKQIDYRPEEVVAIDGVEYKRHEQEYTGALASGALIRRTKAEHKTWLALEESRDAEAATKAIEAKAKADKEATDAAAKLAAAEAEDAQTDDESESAQ